MRLYEVEINVRLAQLEGELSANAGGAS